MKPRITRRDDPLPNVRVLVRVEDDPYQSDHPGFARILRRVHNDGSHDLFCGARRIMSVRCENTLSMPSIPYVILVTDDGTSRPFGRISVSEYHWLQDSIRRLHQ